MTINSALVYLFIFAYRKEVVKKKKKKTLFSTSAQFFYIFFNGVILN
jgi:hypothetical protein